MIGRYEILSFSFCELKPLNESVPLWRRLNVTYTVSCDKFDLKIKVIHISSFDRSSLFYMYDQAFCFNGQTSKDGRC